MTKLSDPNGGAKVGDLVRLSNGEEVYEGRAQKGRLDPEGLLVRCISISTLLEKGYKLEVLKRAKNPLPTKPGLYTGEGGADCLLILEPDGTWLESAGWDYVPAVVAQKRLDAGFLKFIGEVD